MRTTAEIRDRLEAAAAASGRSLAQEVERRLEASFIGDDAIDNSMELAFGVRLYGLMLAQLEAMRRAGRATLALRAAGEGGKDWQERLLNAMLLDPKSGDWLDDPDAYAQATAAARIVVDTFSPGAPTTAQDFQIAARAAQAVIDLIEQPAKSEMWARIKGTLSEFGKRPLSRAGRS